METKQQSQEVLDEQAVMDRYVHGTPLDPDVRKPVIERADKLTAEIRRRFGVQEIAVDLIRESRDE